jgi:3-oxoacyl-[acyl-carrier protein] reductase
LRFAPAARAARNPSRTRYRGHPTATCRARLAGRNQPPPALVQDRRKRIEAGLDGSNVDHPVKIDAPAAASRQSPDSFVAFSPPSRFFSSDPVVQAQALRSLLATAFQRFASPLLKSSQDRTLNADLTVISESRSRAMSKLTGKVAVVTGGSKGIGAEIARQLAANGAAVVVNYAGDREGAAKVVADIKGAGGRAVAVQGNVTTSADVDRVFAEAKSAFGRVDILVNNAGVYRFGAIEEVTEEEFHRHFDINVLGLLLATKAAVAQFGPEGGSVINIGSAISRATPPGTSIYTATKAGVDAITRVLAKELGPRKIRVNSINPGVVETEGTQTAGVIGSDFEAQALQRTPLGRIGQPNDIAPVTVFLASDDSHWVTGEILAVSGGL